MNLSRKSGWVRSIVTHFPAAAACIATGYGSSLCYVFHFPTALLTAFSNARTFGNRSLIVALSSRSLVGSSQTHRLIRFSNFWVKLLPCWRSMSSASSSEKRILRMLLFSLDAKSLSCYTSRLCRDSAFLPALVPLLAHFLCCVIYLPLCPISS